MADMMKGIVLRRADSNGEDSGQAFLVPLNALRLNLPFPKIQKEKGKPVTEEEEALWGPLRTADEVVFEVAGAARVIRSINGIVDPALFRTRCEFSSVFAPLDAEADEENARAMMLGGRTRFATYPTEEIEIDAQNDSLMRALRLGWPLGWGDCALVGGKFGTGKTTIIIRLIEAVLNRAKHYGDVELVVVRIGERGMDIGDEMQPVLLKALAAYPNVFIRHIVAEDGVHPPQVAHNIAEIALATVKRRAENPNPGKKPRKVVYALDGLAGLAGLAYNPLSEDRSVSKGGLTNQTLFNVTRHLAVAGRSEDGLRTVTVIAGALTGQEGTVAGSIYDQVGGPKVSWSHLCVPVSGTRYPKSSIAGSQARKRFRMLSGERARVYEEFTERLERIMRRGDSRETEVTAREYLWRLAAIGTVDAGRDVLDWDGATQKWFAIWAKEDEDAAKKRDEASLTALNFAAAKLIHFSSGAKSGALSSAALAMDATLETYDQTANTFAAQASQMSEKSERERAEREALAEAAKKKLITPTADQYQELARRLHAEGKMDVETFSKFQVRAFQRVPISLADLEQRIRAGETPKDIANAIAGGDGRQGQGRRDDRRDKRR